MITSPLGNSLSDKEAAMFKIPRNGDRRRFSGRDHSPMPRSGSVQPTGEPQKATCAPLLECRKDGTT